MRQIKMKYIVLASMLAAYPVHLRAEDMREIHATPIEDARAIIAAARTEALLDTMFAQLVPVMESAFVGQLSTSAVGNSLLKDIDAKYPGGRDAFGKRFGQIITVGMRAKYPDILEATARKYVERLTPEDLRVARAFYESEAGARLLAAQPELQAQLQQVGQQIGSQVGADSADLLLDEAEKYLGEIK